jgi:LL-diaminopimelate aminotransferase
MSIVSKTQISDRLSKLPIYVFAEIAKLKADLDPNWLIDLSLGSPDSPTPDLVLQSLSESFSNVKNHGYPPFDGKFTLREGIKDWCFKRFGVKYNEQQILPLIGSKEGLAHLPLAFINPGDISLIPNPHYPVHERGTIIAGGEVYDLPLKIENNFLPDLSAIPPSVANKAKMLILSYPNNPTGAIANPQFMKEAVEFCRKYNILLCHDLAYSELGFAGHKPQSIFEYMSLDEPAIEFFTFSKTYHMAGWRIGFCVGNQEIVQSLYALKSNMDYGVSGAVQDAALKALSLPESYYLELSSLYEKRARILRQRLTDELNWKIFEPGGAMYLWVPAPVEYNGNGIEFAHDLLKKVGVVTTPGSAFGSEGKGFVRLALVQPENKLEEAVDRIVKAYS